MRVDDSATTLVAARALRPGTRYELYHSNGQPVLLGKPRGAPIGWVTEEAVDRGAPRWRGKPTALAATSTVKGELWVRLSVPIVADDPVVVLVETGPVGRTMPIGSNWPLHHLVQPSEGVVTVGGGPCGGLFHLYAGRHYAVKLTAYDAAGNQSPTRRLELVTPD